MALLFYNILILPIVRLGVSVISRFNPKLREREHSWNTTIQQLQALSQTKRRIWFHVASMGEFEQAKPIIQHLKQSDSALSIVVSFFSPSGFRHHAHYPLADAVVYMPIDSRLKARLFIEAMKPDVAVFIRYELWLNHLAELSKRKIPAFLFCATFPNASLWKFPLFKSFLRVILNHFTAIYTVSERETILFSKIHTTANVFTATDTRFDRILHGIEQARTEPKILPDGFYKPHDSVFVAGSTWEKDEQIISEAIRSLQHKGISLCSIIVPHEPTDEHIAALQRSLPEATLLSNVNSSTNNQIIIVDSIGKLLKLYGYATIVYVGGGFGAGVHSTAEPAGYGVPIASGTTIRRSPDAQNLKRIGALTCVESSDELTQWIMTMITNPNERVQRGASGLEYITLGKGGSLDAAKRIMNYEV
jgi:3-deoxy-D-manno-octulosonic-acid transferase